MNTLLEEIEDADHKTDLRDLGTETLLAIRESYRNARAAYTKAMMATSDLSVEPVREASLRIREINLILDEREREANSRSDDGVLAAA